MATVVIKYNHTVGKMEKTEGGKVNPLRDADMRATGGFRQNLQPDKRRRCVSRLPEVSVKK